MYQEHERKKMGNRFVGITTMTEKTRNKRHSTKSRTQPTQNTTGRNLEIFKNTAYHLHTANNIFKEKMEYTNRNECKNHEEATTYT